MAGTEFETLRPVEPPRTARERLIVALDVAIADEAMRMVDRLGDAVSFYKIGLHLQLSPELHAFIGQLTRAQKQIFLDFKYIDIPATIAGAVSAAAGLGVKFITVIGQGSIVRAAVAARGAADLRILAVTLLTGMSEKELREEYQTPVALREFVERRAVAAHREKCDGVISSPNEVELIRSAIQTKDFLIVTPGIRPAGAASDDQKRTATAYEAIARGADYLVVGRPIIRDPAPRDAAQRIVDEIARALDRRGNTRYPAPGVAG
jgi:orotidine-5'-phosphate decarboxylase